MSMQVTYDQTYPGGPGEDSLNGFNGPVTKAPVTHGENYPGNKQGSAEMNADKTIVVDSSAPSTNFGGKLSDHSTVQAKTVATYRGDE